MGFPSRQPVHARHRHGAHCHDDQHRTQTQFGRGQGWQLAARLILAASLFACPASAETLRIATFDTELGRKGPGLLLRDILRGEDDVQAVIDTLVAVRPDIIHLMGLDHDLEGHALSALQQALAEAGLDYTHAYAAQPNSGLPSGLDLDGNGQLGEARDAQGYGRFTGDSGMAILSRHPIGGVQDFSAFLWADLPGAIPPLVEGQPFPSAEAFAAQRLSSVGHWDVEVLTPDGSLRLLAFAAGTPLYDGDEDRNGRRNHDEITFWTRYLDGDLPWPVPPQPVVVLGRANVDPFDGAGRPEAIHTLLNHPRLQDPEPRSLAAEAQATPGHRGDPALDTADFNDPRPGNLRLDYVLPDTRLTVTGSGVFWPENNKSRFGLVWVDVEI